MSESTRTAELDLSIALYSGLFVRHDAVSNSLRCKLDVLEGLKERGARIGMTVFTQGTDYSGDHVRVTPTVTDLLRQDAFWSADLHIYEFGMRYELFDSVFVVPDDRSILVVEHNTTPAELVDDPVVRAGCEMAMIQRNNLSLATRVACVSEFNLDIARSVGVPEDRLSVLHLPPGHSEAPTTRRGPGTAQGPVRLLYLGRFVRAKGIGDLLDAVERLWEEGDDRFTLTVAGNPQFSDNAVLNRVRTSVERFGPQGKVRMVLRPSDAEVSELFASAHVLVIPSYHEGYCVPVVEALGAGCYVIGYDVANLPNVTGGLGTLVPAGDVTGLRTAIDDFVDRIRAAPNGSAARLHTGRGELEYDAWTAAVTAHLRDYSESAFERRFLGLLEVLARKSSAGLRPGLGEVIHRRMTEVCEQ